MSASDLRTPVHQGGCQCGNVRFSCMSEPIRVGACHCRMCQRATSSPYAVLAEVHRRDLVWTVGQPKIFNSSTHAERGFCNDCGSPLSYTLISSDIIEVFACAFDNPSSVPPTYAVGLESKLPWSDKLHLLPGKTTQQNSSQDFVDQLRSNQAHVP